MKKCPYCAEEIREEAVFCRYCAKRVKGIAVSGIVKIIAVAILLFLFFFYRERVGDLVKGTGDALSELRTLGDSLSKIVDEMDRGGRSLSGVTGGRKAPQGVFHQGQFYEYNSKGK